MNEIICGDFLDLEVDGKFDLVIADPPYNIGKDFGWGRTVKEEKEYVDWSLSWIKKCFSLLNENGLIYIYGFPEILARISVKFPIDNQRFLVWHYTNKAVPHSKFWQRSHESILCLWEGPVRPKLNIDDIREDYTSSFLKGSAGKKRKVMKSRYGKSFKETTYEAHPNGAMPRDVIKVPALAGGAGKNERVFYCKDCGKFGGSGEECDGDIVKHPTQKPFKLTERLILSKSGRILIPFAGSGSECVVAKKLNREFWACEVNPDYCILAEKWLNSSIA